MKTAPYLIEQLTILLSDEDLTAEKLEKASEGLLPNLLQYLNNTVGKSKGVMFIANERHEQMVKHKRSIVSDVKYNYNEQLSFAAALLCAPDPKMFASKANDYSCPEGWDLSIWKRMLFKPYKQRLIIAGALIAAEVDRLEHLNR